MNDISICDFVYRLRESSISQQINQHVITNKQYVQCSFTKVHGTIKRTNSIINTDLVVDMKMNVDFLLSFIVTVSTYGSDSYNIGSNHVVATM